MAKFYLTTAIPYVNAPPHIGHALEFVQADVIARRERLKGKEVFFLTGTDENGQKNFQTALKAGQDPETFVAAHTQLFRDLLSRLNISNDDFIRTRDRERHWPTAQKVWLELERSGDIYKRTYRGLYCVGHETFHPELELVNGECPAYPSRPLEVIEEENYFFRLSKYAAELQSLIERDELKIVPESKKNEILAFIGRGLEDVSFSRPKDKLPWGVPVPGDDSHVMYVWCDALSNYLSGVDYAHAGAKFQKFWPPDLQLIGKDILRFHAAIWPAMLMSAKLPLPKMILVHGFVTSGGEKMSKTLGNVIDPLGLLAEYGTDAVRYFLLREIPTTEDGDITEAKLKARYNADLANGLGNLLSRVLAVGEKFGEALTLSAEDLAESTTRAWQAYETAFASYRLHDALGAIWELIGSTDRYLNKTSPWKLESKDELERVLSSAVIAVAHIAWLLKPFMPETADKILEALTLDPRETTPWQGRTLTLKKTAPLFPRKA